MLVKYLQWRREFVPNGHFNREDVIGIGGLLNTLYLQGYDRIGRPILVVLAGNHKPVSNIDDFKRERLSLYTFRYTNQCRVHVGFRS